MRERIDGGAIEGRLSLFLRAFFEGHMRFPGDWFEVLRKMFGRMFVPVVREIEVEFGADRQLQFLVQIFEFGL